MSNNPQIRLLRVRECQKVHKSFQYFVENYGFIEDKVSNTAIPFTLWPSQIRILKTFLTARLLIILKARQLGLTWLTAAYCLWSCITKPMLLIIVISAKEEWAVEFLDRVRFIRNRLPKWMIPKVGKDGSQHMSFTFKTGYNGKALLISEIKSLATTPEGAQSKTPDILVMDETARNRYASQIYASSKPGIDKAGGRIIVISNSHKDGNGWAWTRGIYQGFMKGSNTFKGIFMPWQDCPERGPEFKAQQIADGMDEDDFSQQYPETEHEAISAMTGSFFGKVLLRHNQCHKGLKGSLIKDRHGEYDFVRNDRGVFELWRYPYELTDKYDGLPWKYRYAIGSDISEGLGRAYSVAYVLDRVLDEMVCQMRSNKIDAYIWADMLYMLSQYYYNAVICPEFTGAGQTTVKRLRDLNANMYTKEIPDKVGNGVTTQYGWSTHSNDSKILLCGDLKSWLRHTDKPVYSQVLIDECSTYIRHEDGQLNPEEKAFGDCVIAAGCTIQAGNSLSKPVKAMIPITGWLAREREKGKTSWTL